VIPRPGTRLAIDNCKQRPSNTNVYSSRDNSRSLVRGARSATSERQALAVVRLAWPTRGVHELNRPFNREMVRIPPYAAGQQQRGFDQSGRNTLVPDRDRVCICHISLNALRMQVVLRRASESRKGLGLAALAPTQRFFVFALLPTRVGFIVKQVNHFERVGLLINHGTRRRRSWLH
jgi:hypothetical protein